MKKFYFKSSLLTLLLSGIAFGQGSETFETQTSLTNSYGNRSFEGETNGIVWNYVSARNEGDYPITSKGIMLRDKDNTLETTISNGIGKLSFDVRKAFTGGSNNRQIEILVDGNVVFTSPTFGTVQTDTTIHSFEVEINKSDATHITFRNAGSQITLDNILWTKAPEITEAPVVSSKTITGTYGVLLTDGNIIATNNPTSWAQTGMPLGIDFDNAGGIFSGTPAQAGTFTAQVTATNGVGTSTAAAVTFEIAKANQTVNYTFANLIQDQGTTFTELPSQTDQGLNIVYTSVDNSIVSTNGNTLSFDGIGSTTITATALNTDNFNEYTTTFDVKANDPNATYCFEEIFDGLTGNSTSGTGSGTAWSGNDNFPTVSSAYQAGDAVRLGTGSKTGAITSKTLDQISGNITVSFDIKGWTSVEGSINVTLGSETKNVVYTAKMADAFENVTVSFDNVTAGSTLKLETSAKRAYLDNVKIQCASNNTTTWDGITWSNGTPDLTKEVILRATPTESFSAKKLTIERDMIIPAGITITVENEIINQNDMTFRFRQGAYLIQNNNSAVNVGLAMFDRSSTPIYRLENLMWSSPVINQNIFEISPNTLTNRFTRFDEASNNWLTNVTASDVFKSGELISFRAPNNYNNYGEGDAQIFNSSFRGQIFNGLVTIPVTKNSNGNNAVGNPYASPINLDALISTNGTVGVNAVYVWTHTKPIVNGAYEGSNWAIYNGIGWNDPAMTSPNIEIAQGFIVQVANAGNLVLNNAMRSTENNPVFYKGQKDRFWLTLSNNEKNLSSSLVGYVNGSTTKFDQNFDAKPFEDKLVGLFSVLNDDLFIIQGRGEFDNEDSFDLAFNVDNAGTYQINLDKFEGVFENQNIYLEDKKLNQVINLTELKSYSFETEAGDVNNRFAINYQNKTLSSNDLSKNKGLLVYAKNKQISISSDETIKSIKLVDISGRQLQSIQNVNTKSYVLNLNVNPQVVVVIVEKNNGKTESKKVILK